MSIERAKLVAMTRDRGSFRVSSTRGRSVSLRVRARPSDVSAGSPLSALAAAPMLKPAGRGGGAVRITMKVTICEAMTASTARAATCSSADREPVSRVTDARP